MALVVNVLDIGLQARQFWFLGDDGLYHLFGVDVGGSWSGPMDSRPGGPGINFGDMKLGNAIAILGLDDLYHIFRVTGNPGAWTDTNQVASVASARRVAQVVHFDEALYLPGINDDIFHRFTVIGQTWTDSAQGYSVPF